MPGIANPRICTFNTGGSIGSVAGANSQTESVRRAGLKAAAVQRLLVDHDVLLVSEAGRADDSDPNVRAMCETTHRTRYHQQRAGGGKGGGVAVFFNPTTFNYIRHESVQNDLVIEAMRVTVEHERSGMEMGFVAVYMRPSASQEALSEALVKFKDALRETDIVGGDVNAAYWRWARDCKNPLDFRARLIGEAFPEDLVFVTDGSPTTIQHRGLTERTVDVLGAVAGLLAKPRTIHDITYSTATHRPIAADLCISTPANLSMTENKTDFTLRPPVAWTACTPEQFERFNATFERTYKRVLRKKTSLDRQHAAIVRSIEKAERQLSICHSRGKLSVNTPEVAQAERRRDQAWGSVPDRSDPEHGQRLAEAQAAHRAYAVAISEAVQDSVGKHIASTSVWKIWRLFNAQSQAPPAEIAGETASRPQSDKFGEFFAAKQQPDKERPPIAPEDIRAAATAPLSGGKTEVAEESKRRPSAGGSTTTDAVRPRITIELLKMLLAEHPTGKSRDCDGVHLKHLTNLTEDNLMCVVTLLQCIVDTGRIPSQWRRTTIVPIVKKPEKLHELSGWRGVASPSYLQRTMERLLIWCADTDMGPAEPEQYGFARGRSATHALAGIISSMQETLRTLVGTRKLDKGTSRRPQGIVIAADLSDAFPSFNPIDALREMRQRGAPLWVTRIAAELHIGRTLCVRWRSRLSREHDIVTGGSQGSVLTPLTWRMIADMLIRKLKAVKEKSGRNKQGICSDPHIAVFADDVTIALTGFGDALRAEAQLYLDAIDEFCNPKTSGIKLSPKTQVLVVHTDARFHGQTTNVPGAKEDRTDFTLHSKSLGEVVPFIGAIKVLGVTIDSHLRFTQHAKLAAAKADEATATIKRISMAVAPARLIDIARAMSATITYAAPAFWVCATQEARHVMTISYNDMMRSAIGAPKSAPIQSALAEAGVRPLHFEILKATLQSSEKLFRLEPAPPAAQALTHPHHITGAKQAPKKHGDMSDWYGRSPFTDESSAPSAGANPQEPSAFVKMNTIFTCGACGAEGHKSSWKMCPLFEERKAARKCKAAPSAGATAVVASKDESKAAPSTAAAVVVAGKDESKAAPSASTTAVVASEDESKTAPGASGATFRCGACGAEGHKSNWKMCPLF